MSLMKLQISTKTTGFREVLSSQPCSELYRGSFEGTHLGTGSPRCTKFASAHSCPKLEGNHIQRVLIFFHLNQKLNSGFATGASFQKPREGTPGSRTTVLWPREEDVPGIQGVPTERLRTCPERCFPLDMMQFNALRGAALMSLLRLISKLIPF
ncbi:hypothetical protein CB1_000736013 [Camelus ferus]|nr:hypothetical protein CB1_000736013 [Camelus ferus]